jgi:hypothetical protein
MAFVDRSQIFGHMWSLHPYKMPSYTALSEKQYLAKKTHASIEMSLYTSNLSPCGFFMFLKLSSRGSHFESFDNIQINVMTVLEGHDFFGE